MLHIKIDDYGLFGEGIDFRSPFCISAKKKKKASNITVQDFSCVILYKWNQSLFIQSIQLIQSWRLITWRWRLHFLKMSWKEICACLIVFPHRSLKSDDNPPWSAVSYCADQSLIDIEVTSHDWRLCGPTHHVVHSITPAARLQQ